MFIHLSHLTIYLALIATLVLLNIITLLIVGGGRSSRSADGAIGNAIEECHSEEELKQLAIYACPCPCHYTKDFPGMRCMDCYAAPCDEGTTE